MVYVIHVKLVIMCAQTWRMKMKLNELFTNIGLQGTYEEEDYDRKKGKYIKTGVVKVRVPSCHSGDRKMLGNHMDDELPFFVKFGPFAIFALRIPIAERYSFFIANSIGFSSYECSRYGADAYGQKRFNKIKDRLMHPSPFESHESDDFAVFSTLKAIDHGNDSDDDDD